MLRIIGGKYRHLQIDAPDVKTTRPTTDKVREALMSALMNDIDDAVILDLFAGSGALGLESLSRGAKKVYFCDHNRRAYETIKRNIKKLNIDEEYSLFCGSYKAFLEKLKDEGIIFDVVYLDPPYALKSAYDEVISFLLDNNMLSNNAVVVKEGDFPFNEDLRFARHKAYRYGIVNVMVERR